MRPSIPTSRTEMFRKLSLLDGVAALCAPVLALDMRDPDVFMSEHILCTLAYVAISFAASLACLATCDVGRELPRYATMRDVFRVIQVSALSALVSACGLLSLSGMADVPRALIAVHFVVLALMLVAIRATAAARRERRNLARLHPSHNPENILVIGANGAAYAYLRISETRAAGRLHVAGILDPRSAFHGRFLHGMPILGAPCDLPRIVAEFAIHGVEIARVIDAREPTSDDAATLCAAARVLYCRLNDLVWAVTAAAPVVARPAPPRMSRRYEDVKRALDLAAAALLLVALAPLMLLVGTVLAFEVGWPVLFWQRRIGRYGRPFVIYKLRTYKTPFDRAGNAIPEQARVAAIGAFLRRFRIDELLQLWNVFVGDMSFVGPRPLLPKDQPVNSPHRLDVRPGITGWAQIHGGSDLAVHDKGHLDEWYVQNLSARLDVAVVLRTCALVFRPGGSGAKLDSAVIRDG